VPFSRVKQSKSMCLFYRKISTNQAYGKGVGERTGKLSLYPFLLNQFSHPEDAESKFLTNDKKNIVSETCFMPIMVKLCLKSSEHKECLLQAFRYISNTLQTTCSHPAGRPAKQVTLF